MKNASPQTQNHIVLKTMNGNDLGTIKCMLKATMRD